MWACIVLPAAITDSQLMFWLICIGSIEAISLDSERALAHISTFPIPLMQSELAHAAESGVRINIIDIKKFCIMNVLRLSPFG